MKKQRKSKSSNYSSARRDTLALLPVESCKIGENIFDNGMGNAFVSRKAPDGSIVMGAFLIDTFCLGVKDATLMHMPQHEYETFLEVSAMADPWKDIKPCCLKKLLRQAVAYAADLGLAPHKAYKQAALLLEDIADCACGVVYEFGNNGKPFYIVGPNDSPAKKRKVLEALDKRCGKDGYDFIKDVEADEDDLIAMADSLFIDSPDEVDSLVEKMKKALPFRAQINPDSLRQLRSSYDWARNMSADVEVELLHYTGDAGGILCGIKGGKNAEKNIIYLSLTHLTVDKKMPCFKEIFEYQKRRVERLRQRAA